MKATVRIFCDDGDEGTINTRGHWDDYCHIFNRRTKRSILSAVCAAIESHERIYGHKVSYFTVYYQD
jgi:hypothetical protein